MKDGHCPKCGADAVYVRHHPRAAYGIGSMMIGGVFSEAAPLDNYVCADCGYVESYLDDRKKLDYIAENWTRVRAADAEKDTRRLPPLPRA